MSVPTFENVKQILNMGGPWTGDVFIGNHLVVSSALADNYLLDSNRKIFFFIKTFDPTGMRKDVYFSIIIYLVEENVLKRYSKKFKAITFSNIEADKLIIHNSFNAEFQSTKESIEISELVSKSILIKKNVI